MIDRAEQILSELTKQSNLRSLRTVECRGKYIVADGVEYLNMSSNDYLGLSDSTELQREFLETMMREQRYVMSNPSSRLMTGNSADYEALEGAVARLYSGKSALVLSSGYMINSGVLPALTHKEDLILADKFVHASIIDGLKLCTAQWRRFNHNDMGQLRALLEQHRREFRNVWVVTESVFSMDGDRAPIAELVALKREFGVQLYLDEAHAFGVCGESGAGCAAAAGLDSQVDVIVATFGKALSSCGAFVAVSPLLREVLVNRMRTLIFSTAMPPINLLWSRFLVEKMANFAPRRQHLTRLVELLSPLAPVECHTHIIPIMTYENAAAIALADKMKQNGFWVTPIRYPTVAQGKARVRVSLSASISEADASKFVDVWRSIG